MKKKCSKCKEEKNVTEFWKKNSSKSGYNSSCKKCNYVKIKNKSCKTCSKDFKPYTTLSKFCSEKCRINHQKSKRKFNWSDEKVKKITGKNNPAYRNGKYCRATKKSNVGQRLFDKNKKIVKNKIIEDYGYLKCEHCGVNNSLRFEAHHIIYRSEKPNHKHLHCTENILILCIKCHNNYHKNKGLRNKIVKDRGLNNLFGNDVLNK